jgi:hypothetical protein
MFFFLKKAEYWCQEIGQCRDEIITMQCIRVEECPQAYRFYILIALIIKTRIVKKKVENQIN